MNQKDINIGIVGYGFIGSALGNWLQQNTQCNLFISDPPKGYKDDLSLCNVIFISIHIPTETDNTQDLTLLKTIIKGLPNVPIFIRTTLLPGVCDELAVELGKNIAFMPEFLREAKAHEDFNHQALIITNARELLDVIFEKKHRIYMSSLEAELAKYAHNDFGALKVTYFNCIYQLCKKNGVDYTKVRDGALLSQFISPFWTTVPGSDGKLGYGGKCFPKDVNALMHFCEGEPLGDLLKLTKEINDSIRV